MLWRPACCRLVAVFILLLSAAEVIAVQTNSGNGYHADEIVLRSGVEHLLQRQDLEAFVGEAKSEQDGIVHKVQEALNSHVSKAKEMLKRSRETFRAAAEKISQDSARRAKKIEDRMHALSVAQCHGKFNDKKAIMPMGKCCCSSDAEAPLMEQSSPILDSATLGVKEKVTLDDDLHPLQASRGAPQCEWMARSGLNNDLECPSHHKLEYTDLVQVRNSGGSSYIDARRIDELLAACVQSPGWQDRMREVKTLPEVMPLPARSEASSRSNDSDKPVGVRSQQLDAILERAFKPSDEMDLHAELQANKGRSAATHQASVNRPIATHENNVESQRDADLHPFQKPSDEAELNTELQDLPPVRNERSLLEVNRSIAGNAAAWPAPVKTKAMLTPVAAMIKIAEPVG